MRTLLTNLRASIRSRWVKIQMRKLLAVASYDAGSVEELNAAENADPAAETSEEAVAVGSIEVDATACRPSGCFGSHAAVDADDDGNVTAADDYSDWFGLAYLECLLRTLLQTRLQLEMFHVLDFTKLTWDVDGGGTITQSFTADDISSV